MSMLPDVLGLRGVPGGVLNLDTATKLMIGLGCYVWAPPSVNSDLWSRGIDLVFD